MKTILVTGGSGFIGSHVIDNLRDKGHKVISFHRHWRTPWRGDVEQFHGDIKDREAVFEAVGLADGVIHLAGKLGTAETVGSAHESVDVNIHGSLHVYDAIERFKVPGSVITVGNPGWASSYPATKLAAETLALMYNKEFGTRMAVVRGLNVFGPRQKAKPVKKFAPNFIRSALLREPIKIFGDGRQIMDVVLVEDCAEILVRALMDDHGCYDRVMEAGMGEEITALETAKLVWSIANPGTRPRIEFLPMRAGEPHRSVTLGDPSTLSPLGWTKSDFTPLEEGMRKTVEWYRANAEFIGIPAAALA